MENYPLLFAHHSSPCYHSDDQFSSDMMMMSSTDHQLFGGPHTTNTQNGLFELHEEARLQASSSDGHRAPEIDQPFAGPESKAKPKPKKVRRQRYAFQTRSHVDILDDGYRWRKYGQKAVKNNKFPRSYYRCTRQGCNVKKQVQRLSKDEAIVVTTYEGSHTHPIERPNDNFEHILNQMQIYSGF